MDQIKVARHMVNYNVYVGVYSLYGNNTQSNFFKIKYIVMAQKKL